MVNRATLKVSTCFCISKGLDTTTPSGQRDVPDARRVFAEFERAIIRERVMAGLARAKADGTRLGRPAAIADDAAKVRAIRAARAAGKSIRAIAREHGRGRRDGLAPHRMKDGRSPRQKATRPTDRPPGRRPLAPPEIASGNARNTCASNFSPRRDCDLVQPVWNAACAMAARHAAFPAADGCGLGMCAPQRLRQPDYHDTSCSRATGLSRRRAHWSQRRRSQGSTSP